MYNIKVYQSGFVGIRERHWQLFFEDKFIFEITDDVHHNIRCGGERLRISEPYDYYKHGGCKCSCRSIFNCKVIKTDDDKYRLVRFDNNNFDKYRVYYELDGAKVSNKKYFLTSPSKSLVVNTYRDNEYDTKPQLIFNDNNIEEFTTTEIINIYIKFQYVWGCISKYNDKNGVFDRYKINSITLFDVSNTMKIFYTKFEDGKTEFTFNNYYMNDVFQIKDKITFDEYVLQIFKDIENEDFDNITNTYKNLIDYITKCSKEIYEERRLKKR
jgi:hypothetical protein